MKSTLQISCFLFLTIGIPTSGKSQDQVPAIPIESTTSGFSPFGADPILPDIESLRKDWDIAGEIEFDTAITLGEMSVLAYNDEHTRRLVLRLLGFDEIVLLDDGPMSGFVAIKGKTAVVAFRGTDMTSPRDWLTNADLFRQKSMKSNQKFHRGFQDAYQRFSETIRLTLPSHQIDRLWITGHSLGGAMAVCCAYDLVEHRIPISGLVTFGQPRVANQPMALYLDQVLRYRYLRFVNLEDLVPHIPTTKPAVISDYRHAGELAWFQDGHINRNRYLLQAVFNGSTDAELPESSEVENDITTEELILLQRSLKTMESDEGILKLPRVLLPDAPRTFYRPESAAAPAAVGTNIEDLFGPSPEASNTVQAEILATGFSNKFSDHSMLEYMRQLNEFERMKSISSQ